DDLGPAISFTPTPSVSPDGRWVACCSSDGPPRWARAEHVLLYPLMGGGAPRPLAPTPDGQTQLVGWSADGRAVLTLDWAGTASPCLAVPIEGGPPQALSDTSLVKTRPAANQRGQVAF